MTTPTPTHSSLEMLVEIAQQTRDNADVFFADLLSRWDTEAENTATFRESLFTLLNDINGRVDGINAALETLNNNASLNAQTTQQILLDQAGQCCDDTAFGTGEVEDLCQLSQDAIAYVVARMLSIGATYSGQRLPTVAELVTLFTYVGTDGRSYPLLSSTEAGQLVGALNQLGVGSLGDLSCLLEDEPVQAAVLELLGTSNSAEQSYIRIRALPVDGYDCSPGAVRAFFAAFSPTLINTLWKSIPIWDPAPYEDICGPPAPTPPEDAFGFGGSSLTLTADGDSELTYQGLIDLSTYSTAVFRPLPSDSIGYTLYWHNCGNETTNSDKNLYIYDSDEPGGTLVLTVPATSTVAWVVPSAIPYLYIWSYGRPVEDPGGGFQLHIAWTVEEVEAHCTI